MPIYQYECKTCGYSKENVEFGAEINKEHICPDCGNVLTRLFPDTMRFKLKYNPKKDRVSWGNEGYAETQYYKEVNKQRAEGKDVRPLGED